MVSCLLLKVAYCFYYILGIGIRSVYRATVKPNKTVSASDTQYVFEIPDYGDSLIDLQGILLKVGGRMKRLRANGEYGGLTVRTKGTKEIKENPITVCNTLYSLFSDIKVTMGPNQVNMDHVCVCVCLVCVSLIINPFLSK